MAGPRGSSSNTLDASTGTAAMICRKCSRDLPGSAFYKTLRTKCKECHKAQMSAHYQRPEYKAKNAAYQRGRLNGAGNLEKHKARQAVRWAVKSGKIAKDGNCALCNSGQDIEAHHRDYSKKLEVIWLCRNCHAIHHAAEAIKQRRVQDKGMSILGDTDDITQFIHYKTRQKTDKLPNRVM